MITGSQIRDARKRAGLSQADLAKRVGVVPRTVGAWERGETSPGIAEQRLLEVLRDQLVATGEPPLRSVSDAELLAEIARRFARNSEQVTLTDVPAVVDFAYGPDVILKHPDGRWVAIEVKTTTDRRSVREGLRQMQQTSRFFGWRPEIIEAGDTVPDDLEVAASMTLDEFNSEAEAYLSQHVEEVAAAARTTGRAPSGQRLDEEERAVQLGGSVVAEALREKERRDLQNGDEATDEQDIG